MSEIQNLENITILQWYLQPFCVKAGISKSSSGILVDALSAFTTSLFMSYMEETILNNCRFVVKKYKEI